MKTAILLAFIAMLLLSCMRNQPAETESFWDRGEEISERMEDVEGATVDSLEWTRYRLFCSKLGAVDSASFEKFRDAIPNQIFIHFVNEDSAKSLLSQIELHGRRFVESEMEGFRFWKLQNTEGYRQDVIVQPLPRKSKYDQYFEWNRSRGK